MQSLDQKNKRIYSDISFQTIDYLSQLYKIKINNKELYEDKDALNTNSDSGDDLSFIFDEEKPLRTNKNNFEKKTTFTNSLDQTSNLKKGNDSYINNTNSINNLLNENNCDLTKSTIIYPKKTIAKKRKDIK
jgi:hypothetical protein